MKYWFKNVADNIYIYPKSAPRNLILQIRTSDCNSALRCVSRSSVGKVYFRYKGKLYYDSKFKKPIVNKTLTWSRRWGALVMKNLFHNKRIRHFFIVDGSYLLFNLIYCLVFKHNFITTHTIIMFIFMNICLFIGTQDEE